MSKDAYELEPWLITGFTDGEGCFALFVRADKQKRKNSVATYYRWQVDFAITLRGDDIDMLQKIKAYFRCGTVSLSKKTDSLNAHNYGQAGYHITAPNDLIKNVISHFEKYPLRSKKQKDFELWKEAVVIIKKAKDRKKSLFDKVTYSFEENQKLISILDALKTRVTGGQFSKKRVDYNMQGNKVVTE